MAVKSVNLIIASLIWTYLLHTRFTHLVSSCILQLVYSHTNNCRIELQLCVRHQGSKDKPCRFPAGKKLTVQLGRKASKQVHKAMWWCIIKYWEELLPEQGRGMTSTTLEVRARKGVWEENSELNLGVCLTDQVGSFGTGSWTAPSGQPSSSASTRSISSPSLA